MKNDISKLPKWAQKEFEKMEHEVKSLQKRLDTRKNELQNPDFYVYDILDNKCHHGFTDRFIVRFPVTSDRCNSHISVSLRNGNLYINSDGDDLVVRPEASNTLTLMMKDTGKWYTTTKKH